MQVDFYPALRDFLSTPRGARYQQDLVFMNDDSTQELISARSSFRWRYMEETTVRVRSLQLLCISLDTESDHLYLKQRGLSQ